MTSSEYREQLHQKTIESLHRAELERENDQEADFSEAGDEN
jgi:hypothetical protein